MDKDYILRVLRECADEALSEPTRNMRIQHYEELVNRKWAAKEVIKKIEQSDLPPEETLEELINDIAKHRFRTEKAEVIFSTLSDMAESMLDIVRAMSDE